ncbi:MAG: class II fumarate hydratase [Candidatus Hydrothermales bacterium]
MKGKRVEVDPFGEVEIPDNFYYGAHTQRAIENLSVSDFKIPFELIKALSLIKICAAEVNYELFNLDEKIYKAILKAGEEIYEGKLSDNFPLDIFQSGSGTNTNMNVNEVIAGRANEILTGKKGGKSPCHPNDHVNLGQSSNDVIPSAMQISSRLLLDDLIKELKNLVEIIKTKEREFKKVIKIGRTHLQDAVPMTLGQEFSAYRAQIESNIKRIKKVFNSLIALPLGGTAIGTGVGAHPEFGKRICKKISKRTNINFREAKNKFEYISSRDCMVELMGALNTLATSLMKISNDLRLLSSGPLAGLNEIELPSLQAGSSIMPGKVNPVIPEMMIQICAFVHGAYNSVVIGAETGPLELNMMMPLISFLTINSIKILTKGVSILSNKCIKGIKANEEVCRRYAEMSLALITSLTKKLGYDKASEIVLKARRERKTLREVLIEEKILSEREIDQNLNPFNMI